MKLATTHINTDMDGLASLVALYHLEGPLELAVPGSMDTSTHRFWQDHRDQLPEVMTLRHVRKRLGSEPLERLLVVDTSDRTRLGVIGEYVDEFEEVRAWDTHPSAGEGLPTVEMPPVCACVSALVIDLEAAGKQPSPTEAGLFLLGIHVDTGHFTYLDTTELDHRAAAICLRWGAPIEWAATYAPKGFTVRQLELLERMAQTVEFVNVGGVSVAQLFIELDNYEPDLAVLLGQLLEAENWPAAFLLASISERTFVIGRSQSDLDVSQVVGPLGGGGHARAASTILRGVTLSDARSLVRETLVEQLGRGPTAGQLAVSPFLSLPTDASIREAANLLHQRRINAIPLHAGNGDERRYVGLVSRQEVEAAIRHGLADQPVIEISHSEPIWVDPGAPLGEAARALVNSPSRLILVGTPPRDVGGILTRGIVFRAVAPDPHLAESKRPPRPEMIVSMGKKRLGRAWPIIVRLGELGDERDLPVHVVGGTARDLLLGLPVRDIDLVVEGHAPTLAREASRRVGGVVRVHEAFATASWEVDDDLTIDMASTRSEYYESPAALPRISRAGLRQDLYRRDFTINAVAVSVSPDTLGTIYDPFGGLVDQEHGIIRVLHGLSFYDDPTRAFRAGRFAARLDFKLAPGTLGLMRAALRSGIFGRLSPKRLGTEIEHILEEREVEQAFRLLREWHLLEQIHPDFKAGRRFFERLGQAQAARHRFQGLTSEAVPPQPDVLWIAVASAVPREQRRDRSDMVPGGRARRRLFREGPARVAISLHALSRARTAARAARTLQMMTPAERIVALGWADRKRVVDWLTWWEREGRLIGSAVDGNVLIELGYQPGRLMGEALRAALDAARNGANADEQLRVATRVYDKAQVRKG
jgi:tRNA nucleotidyltransferase (CCA-adding enzyme)